jgi:enamine deaminase RidA (YjgF/YER057c/UK114 family)
MPATIDAKLDELGISLPKAPPPQGNYVPWVRTGNLVFLSGQVALIDGTLHHQGTVGADVSLEDAQDSARLCAVNLIAQLQAACEGNLDRVVRCIKLGGFVNCGAGFNEQPKVVNGASDLMVAVFGDAGRHARFAVGASSLPLGASVEVDAVFEIE